jgi:hypothetical protein
VTVPWTGSFPGSQVDVGLYAEPRRQSQPSEQPESPAQSPPPPHYGRPPGTSPSSGMPMSDAELIQRISAITEQVMTARGEVALGRAAYERACEEELAERPWLTNPMVLVTAPRVGRALRARVAAVERFGLWARELDWLHREARARGLLFFPG